LDGRR